MRRPLSLPSIHSITADVLRTSITRTPPGAPGGPCTTTVAFDEILLTADVA